MAWRAPGPINDNLRLNAQGQASEFDEVVLRTVALGAFVGVNYRVPERPFEITASPGYDKLTGRDTRPGAVVAQIGVLWRFGATGPSVRQQGFTNPAAFDPLLRRGMF